MMKHPDLFELMFPATAAKFELSVWAGSRFLEREHHLGTDPAWHAALLADELLVRCISHREAHDCFSRPRVFAMLYLFRSYIPGNEGIMAKTTQVKQSERADWRGFFDRRLTDEELAVLDEWKPKSTEIFDLVDAAMTAGYRFTLSYNKKTKLATCSMIDDDATRKTGGYALSTGESDGALALKAMLFKHFRVLDADWSGLLGSSPAARRG